MKNYRNGEAGPAREPDLEYTCPPQWVQDKPCSNATKVCSCGEPFRRTPIGDVCVACGNRPEPPDINELLRQYGISDALLNLAKKAAEEVARRITPPSIWVAVAHIMFGPGDDEEE